MLCELREFLSAVACMLAATLVAANGNSLVAISKEVPRAYDPMIFGSFLEHFHRQIYGGVFEPGSKLADADGFRTDVIAALKEIKTPIVRWPGGCFVSAYHWKDGVGKTRESVLDKAWFVEEPNTFGTDEYVKWCRRIQFQSSKSTETKT